MSKRALLSCVVLPCVCVFAPASIQFNSSVDEVAKHDGECLDLGGDTRGSPDTD